MSDCIVEFFGYAARSRRATDWASVVRTQRCPYLDRKCIKIRKSKPEVSIGTCTVNYGEHRSPIMICPIRLLENGKIFTDSLHLLTLHEPGNELHVVPEISIPGGSVDYFLVSVNRGKAVDFVGIELQTLDTTGTVWPARERFLHSLGLPAERKAIASRKTFGMNWSSRSRVSEGHALSWPSCSGRDGARPSERMPRIP